MSTRQTVKEIKNAVIIINRQKHSAINVKVEKLEGLPPIQPLTGENPQHPTRFQLHANLVDNPNLSSLTDVELPKIDITNTDDNISCTLSQAKIKYFSDNELKITATHFK